MNLFPYLRTLIIDDKAFSMESLKANLHALGFSHVDSADRATTATQMAVQYRYDLIFVALEMEEISWFEYLRYLRGQSRLSSTLLIATGLYRSARGRFSTIQAGADLFVSRPVLASTLRTSLIALLTSSVGQKAKIVPFGLGKCALERAAHVNATLLT